MESHHYDATAELHEVHMPAAWDRLRDVVTTTLGEIEPDGVVADIGAGSGLGSAMLADVTDAEIIALEPNPTMRAMLVARLDTAGVLERVTVLPEAVPEGLDGLPDRVDGVIAAHMLGHLTNEERTRLLEWIATSLAPGRSALLTVGAEVPEQGHEPVVDERTVGRFVYRVTHHMPAPGRYEGLFEVIDGQQRVVRSVRDAVSWETVTAADIRAVLTRHPVKITEPQPGVVLVSRLRI
jgi:SAM-dependent methyltransferase